MGGRKPSRLRGPDLFGRHRTEHDQHGQKDQLLHDQMLSGACDSEPSLSRKGRHAPPARPRRAGARARLPAGGVRRPGGVPRLQSGWDGCSPSGGFDSRPPPPKLSARPLTLLRRLAILGPGMPAVRLAGSRSRRHGGDRDASSVRPIGRRGRLSAGDAGGRSRPAGVGGTVGSVGGHRGADQGGGPAAPDPGCRLRQLLGRRGHRSAGGGHDRPPPVGPHPISWAASPRLWPATRPPWMRSWRASMLERRRSRPRWRGGTSTSGPTRSSSRSSDPNPRRRPSPRPGATASASTRWPSFPSPTGRSSAGRASLAAAAGARPASTSAPSPSGTCSPPDTAPSWCPAGPALAGSSAPRPGPRTPGMTTASGSPPPPPPPARSSTASPAAATSPSWGSCRHSSAPGCAGRAQPPDGGAGRSRPCSSR